MYDIILSHMQQPGNSQMPSLSPQARQLLARIAPLMKGVTMKRDDSVKDAMYSPGSKEVRWNPHILDSGNYPQTDTKYADRAIPHEIMHHIHYDLMRPAQQERIRNAYKEDLAEWRKGKSPSELLTAKVPYHLTNEYEYAAEHLTDEMSGRAYPYAPADRMAKDNPRKEVFGPLADRFMKGQAPLLGGGTARLAGRAVAKAFGRK